MPAASAANCVHSTYARYAARRISIMQPSLLTATRLSFHLLNLLPDFFLLLRLRLQLPLIQRRNNHTVHPVHCLLLRLRIQLPQKHRNHHNVHHVLRFSLVLLARHSCPFFNVSDFIFSPSHVQCCLRRTQRNSIVTQLWLLQLTIARSCQVKPLRQLSLFRLPQLPNLHQPPIQPKKI